MEFPQQQPQFQPQQFPQLQPPIKESELEIEKTYNSPSSLEREPVQSSLPTMSSPIIIKTKKNTKSKTIKNKLPIKIINNINHLIHNLSKDLKTLKLKFKTLKLMIYKTSSKTKVITKHRVPKPINTEEVYENSVYES